MSRTKHRKGGAIRALTGGQETELEANLSKGCNTEKIRIYF